MLGLKNLTMLPIYFDYLFVHLRQKARIRPKLIPEFCEAKQKQTFWVFLGPNPTRKAQSDLQLCYQR